MNLNLKKIVLAAAASTAALAMCGAVSADEYDLNQNVDYITVQGVDYNYTDRTESVDGVTYDTATNTITVENCNIDDKLQRSFIDYCGTIPLNVVFKGNNTFKTVTSKYDDGRESAVTNFISSSPVSIEDYNADNPDIVISGNGTISLENYDSIIHMYGATSGDNSLGDISIDGVALNANSGDITSLWGNISISNATVSIVEDKYLGYNSGGVIDCGTNYDSTQDKDGNGTLTVTNSKVEIKKCPDEYGDVSPLISCKKLSVSGCNIYAGKDKAQYTYTASTFLSESTYNYEQELTYYNADTLNYVLITPENRNLPAPGSDTQKETNANQETRPAATQNNNQSNQSANRPSSGAGAQTKYTPGKAVIRKVKNVKGKKAKITWKAVKGARGYQLQYGLNKKITKQKKSVYASGTSKTVKRLKKKKTYYFRVRAYSVYAGGKVYGKWSSVKKVKIKK